MVWIPGSIKNLLDVCGHEFKVKLVSMILHFSLDTYSSIGTDLELKKDWIYLGYRFPKWVQLN